MSKFQVYEYLKLSCLALIAGFVFVQLNKAVSGSIAWNGGGHFIVKVLTGFLSGMLLYGAHMFFRTLEIFNCEEIEKQSKTSGSSDD